MKGRWLKIKNYQETEVNLLGYKNGCILVGEGNRVQGHAVGMSKADRVALWEIISRYGKLEDHTVWLPSGIRCRVKFTKYTPKGKMRDCHWVGFEN